MVHYIVFYLTNLLLFYLSLVVNKSGLPRLPMYLQEGEEYVKEKRGRTTVTMIKLYFGSCPSCEIRLFTKVHLAVVRIGGNIYRIASISTSF